MRWVAPEAATALAIAKPRLDRITRHSVSPKSPASSAAMAVSAATERPPTSAQPAALRTLSR